MNPRSCKKMNCPRLRENSQNPWDIPVCQAQDNMDQIGEWLEPVEGITKEQCQRLRNMLMEKREVQV